MAIGEQVTLGALEQMRGQKGFVQKFEEKERQRQQDAIDARSKLADAFYREQLGLSEKAGREAVDAGPLRMQEAMQNAPKREKYLDPTATPQEQQQQLQYWWRDFSTYMTANYPDLAKDLNVTGEQVGAAVSKEDVTISRAATEAKTERDVAEAASFRAGVDAKGIETTEQSLWEADQYLREQSGGGWGGPSEGETQRLAARAMQLEKAAATQLPPGATPRPLREYIAQAYQEMQASKPPAEPGFLEKLGGMAGGGGASPTAPTPMPNQQQAQPPQQPPAGQVGGRRLIDLTNPSSIR